MTIYPDSVSFRTTDWVSKAMGTQLNMESTLSIIFNTYYYVFFKKDPCKKCLVQPCCSIRCPSKIEWDFYTDRGEHKTPFQVFNLIVIVYGIIMILFAITKLAISQIEYADVAQRQSVLVSAGKVAHNQKVSSAPINIYTKRLYIQIQERKK